MLRPIQPYVEYFLNKEYIVEFLCINKDKPELKCDGKCHLAKQIKKQQENEPKSMRVSLENYPIGFINIYNIQSHLILITSSDSGFSYSNLYYSDYKASYLKPPESVVSM